MVTVADTSFLVSIYLEQSFSAKARDITAEVACPMQFTTLHRYELRMAIRLAVFRSEIDEVQRASAFGAISLDLTDGILVHAPLSWTNLLREADALGARHAEKTGARSIDTLHVAAATLLHTTDFLSFDMRQRELAKRAGLKVWPRSLK